MSLWKNTIFMSVHPTGFFCRELPWSLTGFPHRHSANQPADRNPSLSRSSKYSQSATADASQAQSQVISLPIFNCSLTQKQSVSHVNIDEKSNHWKSFHLESTPQMASTALGKKNNRLPKGNGARPSPRSF